MEAQAMKAITNFAWYLFDLFADVILVYACFAGFGILALVAFKILVLFGC